MAGRERSLFDFTDANDVCAGRHRGAAGSVEAFARVRPIIGTRCRLVLGMVAATGGRGLTLDETCVELGRTPNALSPIFTELKRRRLVQVVGRRPARSGVRVAIYRVTLLGEEAMAAAGPMAPTSNAARPAGGDR